MSGVRGVVPMLVTPFDAAGKVDERSLRRLVAHEIESGAHGLAALGLAGEGIYLSRDERELVASIVIDGAGDTPVLIGCTADSTDAAVALVEDASRLGASEVMVAPPRRSDWGPAEFREHYRQVAAAATCDVMVQDAPFALGVELGVGLVLTLSEELPNVRSYKVEALPYWENAVRARDSAGVRLRVLGGHGGLYLLDVLDSGADGLIPGADLTAKLVKAWDAHALGDRVDAERIHSSLLPLLVYQAQSLGLLVGGAKTLLHRRGIIETTLCRLPEAHITDVTRNRLVEVAQACGIC